MVDPTRDPLVVAPCQGHLSNDVKRGYRPPLRSALLPSEKVEWALQHALQSNSHHTLKRWGILVAGFLICSRPTNIRYLRRCDIQFDENSITVQITHCKCGERGTSPRIALRIPYYTTEDAVIKLVQRLFIDAPTLLTYIFSNRSVILNQLQQCVYPSLNSSIIWIHQRVLIGRRNLYEEVRFQQPMQSV